MKAEKNNIVIINGDNNTVRFSENGSKSTFSLKTVFEIISIISNIILVMSLRGPELLVLIFCLILNIAISH